MYAHISSVCYYFTLNYHILIILHSILHNVRKWNMYIWKINLKLIPSDTWYAFMKNSYIISQKVISVSIKRDLFVLFFDTYVCMCKIQALTLRVQTMHCYFWRFVSILYSCTQIVNVFFDIASNLYFKLISVHKTNMILR